MTDWGNSGDNSKRVLKKSIFLSKVRINVKCGRGKYRDHLYFWSVLY